MFSHRTSCVCAQIASFGRRPAGHVPAPHTKVRDVVHRVCGSVTRPASRPPPCHFAPDQRQSLCKRNHPGSEHHEDSGHHTASQLPALFFYLLSKKIGVRANKKTGQAASPWQFVVGRFQFMCIRGWWRLLLALRVPAPRLLRPSLWAGHRKAKG